MVRAIIFISALLIAAVTAAPSPDPLIGAKVNKYIGLGKVRATHVGKNLLNLDGLKVHDVGQGVNVGGEGRGGLGGLLKRDDEAPVKIVKVAGIKGIKTNNKNKGAVKGHKN